MFFYQTETVWSLQLGATRVPSFRRHQQDLHKWPSPTQSQWPSKPFQTLLPPLPILWWPFHALPNRLGAGASADGSNLGSANSPFVELTTSHRHASTSPRCVFSWSLDYARHLNRDPSYSPYADFFTTIEVPRPSLKHLIGKGGATLARIKDLPQCLISVFDCGEQMTVVNFCGDYCGLGRLVVSALCHGHFQCSLLCKKMLLCPRWAVWHAPEQGHSGRRQTPQWKDYKNGQNNNNIQENMICSIPPHFPVSQTMPNHWQVNSKGHKAQQMPSLRLSLGLCCLRLSIRVWALLSLVYCMALHVAFWFLFSWIFAYLRLTVSYLVPLLRCLLDSISWAFYRFYFFRVFFFLSTQGTFNGDRHLLSIFLILIFRIGSLSSHFGGKGLHSKFCCTCGCSLLVICNELWPPFLKYPRVWPHLLLPAPPLLSTL